MASLHPFDPITADEIRLVVRILEKSFSGVKLRYKRNDIQEPMKKEVIPYIEAERLGQPLPPKPSRLAYAIFHRLDNRAFYKALFDLTSKAVIYAKELPKHVQMQLPPGVVVCTEPWMYGTDTANENRRLFQCYLYVVEINHPENHHYSVPCRFSPVFGITHELVRVDYLPTGLDHTVRETQPWKPVKTVQYAHELLDEPMRQDLKPYIVQQPQGASFSTEGNVVSWQKWRFRVGFNSREGLVIYNVTYDGRNTFYCLSLSEMTVPYGDPRAPYHRKQAFDIGDVGFGITANQLSLGCDCLGHIHYFDGHTVNSSGEPKRLDSVICLHEVDQGLQHKHVNYRTNTATVVRNRQLVVQMICTFANYEYIFAFIFDQAANIELEVRATGILSTTPFDDDTEGTLPWSTTVGPGVAAPYHQHLWSLRIDPAIDGFKNTVFYEDSVPMPISEYNPYGVGYITEKIIMKTSGSAQTSVDRHRVFKMCNANVINPLTKKLVAYKIHTVPSQMPLAHPSTFGYQRAGFATQPIWVSKYKGGELYAAGEFTNQSTSSQNEYSEGIDAWVGRKDPIENEDVVVWHAFGLTHNPRPEDFPVMPHEKINVVLKPDHFFAKNLALDGPPSTQAFNKSVLHEEPFKSVCCSGKAILWQVDQ
ncbi:copper amine oxidase [Aspergillus caelatus]|uniref:Amine oxidase n=1 Tax=Aspergillus caelatus TaxID=61420 RepID=A0A5N6ZVT7_9EURO|nr:copper amine oxidase [Aspergillus caelatus]KAE8360380.1 copper amine oxidase [Aspergillus caelatus]